ncbi:MAG: alpha/beta hydrolase [Solobacterium sp.]|nr:alpha/beta hydrolase [Solobacterium sp.]
MSEKQEINGVQTAFRHSGSGRDVVLLHGWGQNMEMMSAIERHLSPSFSVWNLDFPGFGESEEPHDAWGMEEYTSFLSEFIRHNRIEEPILIGHSFGCRSALRYAAENPVRKMVLTGAAGIKPEQNSSVSLKVKGYKAAKWVLQKTHQDKALEKLQDRSGSEDYRNAHGVMRQTFVKVVNDDVTPFLKDVNCPVLLVWGEFDAAVPLAMGKKLEQLLPDAGLAVFEGDDHFAYWHQADRFNRVLDVFLKEDRI